MILNVIFLNFSICPWCILNAYVIRYNDEDIHLPVYLWDISRKQLCDFVLLYQFKPALSKQKMYFNPPPPLFFFSFILVYFEKNFCNTQQSLLGLTYFTWFIWELLYVVYMGLFSLSHSIFFYLENQSCLICFC